MSRKRKHRAAASSTFNEPASTSLHFIDEDPVLPPFDPSLRIQAYEADIIRGPSAALAARSLEISKDGRTRGDALICWGGEDVAVTMRTGFGLEGVEDTPGANDAPGLWMDRYDVRLLLDKLPSSSSRTPSPVPAATRAESPGGWSDLPSDAEDTFFLSPSEVEDYRRDKRRKLIDSYREERVRARRAEDGDESEEEEEEEEVWGGSDEEPDEMTRDLMRRTASHLVASPNPAQLEMRILANHGGDKRFAFLRGRFTRVWGMIKAKGRLEENQKKRKAAEDALALQGLEGYGDSDSDGHGSDDLDGGESAGGAERFVREVIPALPQAQSKVSGDQPGVLEGEASEVAVVMSAEEFIKEARRARAKEWSEKRRAMKAKT